MISDNNPIVVFSGGGTRFAIYCGMYAALEDMGHTDIEIMTDVPLHTAMRISLSDMFYASPVRYGGNYFTGGAIDLVPVELAKGLGGIA